MTIYQTLETHEFYNQDIIDTLLDSGVLKMDSTINYNTMPITRSLGHLIKNNISPMLLHDSKKEIQNRFIPKYIVALDENNIEKKDNTIELPTGLWKEVYSLCLVI